MAVGGRITSDRLKDCGGSDRAAAVEAEPRRNPGRCLELNPSAVRLLVRAEDEALRWRERAAALGALGGVGGGVGGGLAAAGRLGQRPVVLPTPTDDVDRPSCKNISRGQDREEAGCLLEGPKDLLSSYFTLTYQIINI